MTKTKLASFRFCNRIVITLLISFLISSCSEDQGKKPVYSDLNSDISIAREKFGDRLENYSRAYLFDGSLHHLKLVIRDGFLSKKIAMYPDGKITSLVEANKELRRLYEDKWGVLTPSSAKRLFGSDTDSNWTFYASIRDDVSLNDLRDFGLRDFHFYEGINMISGGISSDNLIHVAKSGLFDRVSIFEYTGVLPVNNSVVSTGGNTPNGIPSGADYLNTPDNFNSNGVYGQGIDVAIWEINHQCRIYSEHEAFDFIGGVTYLDNNFRTCSEDKECDPCNPSNGSLTNKCIDGICVVSHGTQVSSIVSSSNDGNKYHASQVNLIVHNKRDIYGNQGQGTTLNELLSSFNDLAEGTAKIVNGSFGFLWYNTGTTDVEKLYIYMLDKLTRDKGITFVMAAGNSITVTQKFCAANVITVGAADANNTYDDYLDDLIWPTSSYLNPQSPSESLDIECPDVVAEGSRTDVASFNTPTSWYKSDGTSLSAPGITGLLALMDSHCEPYSPLHHRALLRNSAFVNHRIEQNSYNPSSPMSDLSPVYPVPGLDYVAGTGIPNSDFLYSVSKCNGPGSGNISVETDIDLQSGWEPVPVWMQNEDKTYHSNIKSYPEYFALRQSTGERKILSSVYNMSEGDRIRASLSYNTCPDDFGSMVGTWDISHAVDFDIALCGKTAGQDVCVGMSERVFDVDEGFDIILPFDLTDASMWLIKPAGVISGCNNESKERIGFSLTKVAGN